MHNDQTASVVAEHDLGTPFRIDLPARAPLYWFVMVVAYRSQLPIHLDPGLRLRRRRCLYMFVLILN